MVFSEAEAIAPADGGKYKIVVEPMPEGCARFLVFRSYRGSRKPAVLIGSGTRDSAASARDAAECMAARLPA